MTRSIPSMTRLKTALGLRAQDPLARMMAGFTGFAVAMTLILVTAIPVQADRKPAFCANELTEMAMPCAELR
jgi:hypothetical protein